MPKQFIFIGAQGSMRCRREKAGLAVIRPVKSAFRAKAFCLSVPYPSRDREGAARPLAYARGSETLVNRLQTPSGSETLFKLAAAVSLVTVTALLGYLTYQRNLDYYDPLTMWQDVLKKRPDNSRALNNVGKDLYDQGKNEEALKYFNKALELKPGFAEAYYNRGLAYYGKGDYDRAAADYTRVLSLDPRFAEAYNNRGIALGKKGDYDGAIADFTQALELKPGYKEAYTNRGAARKGKGDYAGAAARSAATTSSGSGWWRPVLLDPLRFVLLPFVFLEKRCT